MVPGDNGTEDAEMTPSGSRSSLLLLCQFWGKEGVVGPPEDPNEFSEYGTCTHTVGELQVQGREPDMCELQKKHRLNDYDRDQSYTDGKALANWVRENIPGPYQTELAYAFNTDDFTARVLPSSGGHRDYSSKLPSEYCGTMDLVSVQGAMAYVVDYKTGHTEAESYREQLEFGALVVSLSNPGVRRVRCVVLKVSDGQCYPLQWEIDTSDIDDIGMQIQLAFRQIPNAEPQPGRHCWEKFCPLRGSCPATVEPVMSLVKASYPEELGEVTPADVTTDVAITSLPQALRVYALYRRMSNMLDVVKKGLERYADQTGGIPTAPGKIWGADEGSREYLKLTADAEAYLKRELGPRFAAVEANISKQSLKKAAGAKLEPILEGLRKCGAAKPSAFTQYKERKVS